MNTPVSFPLAKLLKEKRFDLSTERFYPKPKCKLFGIDEHGRHYPIVNKTQTYFKGKAAVLKEENYYDAPTIADVVMWIYEKYGIWIISRKSGSLNKWFYTIYKNDDFIVTKTIHSYDTTHDEFVSNSLTESYEAAIEYTLNNLI